MTARQTTKAVSSIALAKKIAKITENNEKTKRGSNQVKPL
jgi:hypothetical protein